MSVIKGGGQGTMVKRNILLTGRPGVGKSTLLLKITEMLKNEGLSPGGFYTLEVTEDHKRCGFDIHTLDGLVVPLARVGLASNFHLGRYGIAMQNLEDIALAALARAIDRSDVIVIDEIGYMELKSMRFRDLVLTALDSNKPLVATVMRNTFDLPDKIKARSDIVLFTVWPDNRDQLGRDIVRILTGSGR